MKGINLSNSYLRGIAATADLLEISTGTINFRKF